VGSPGRARPVDKSQSGDDKVITFSHMPAPHRVRGVAFGGLSLAVACRLERKLRLHERFRILAHLCCVRRRRDYAGRSRGQL
jgi:hypothetical protein